uniref:Reverse transcriptase domain-containing protein n=1 Tax=Bracon brevicornis TaxID=1563983 RepID=A0A6V7KNU3_9HYME
MSPVGEYLSRQLPNTSESRVSNRTEIETSNRQPNSDTTLAVCPYCGRTFKNSRALGVHRASQHPAENNELISTERIKARWNTEHLRLLAAAEARAPATIRFMNLYLAEKAGTGRSQESIKKQRQKPEYKNLVDEYRAIENRVNQPNEAPYTTQTTDDGGHRECSQHRGPTNSLSRPLGNAESMRIEADENSVKAVIGEALKSDLEAMRNLEPGTRGASYLVAAINKALMGADSEREIESWFYSTFPELRGAQNVNVRNRRVQPMILSRRKQRKSDYKDLQQLWRKNMSKAARKVLDGDAEAGPHPELATQELFWRPIFEERNPTRDTNEPKSETKHWEICKPISHDEITGNKPDSKSAAGPDGLRAGDWLGKVPDRIKATIFHIFQYTGRVPALIRNSRTILIPKEAGTMDPAKFRPISIASVIIRHYHKILSSRLLDLPILDKRQRAFIKADGLADNIFVLATVIADARILLKELHLAAVDVRKAFDTVSHEAIERVMTRNGLPDGFVEYVMNLYRTSSTVIEVDGVKSRPIFPGQGVRQGDPLSSFIFNLAINEVLKKIPVECGYILQGRTVSALAFADDLILLAGSREGLQISLNRAMESLADHGLKPMPSKCRAMSLVPSGRDKKVKTVTESLFRIDGALISQIGVLDTWDHLGVSFGNRGPTAPVVRIEDLLGKVTRAPLKPQQRMTILRKFLIPRFLHKLTFGNTTHGALRGLDKAIRISVRKWLFLPKDVPIAYIHAKISEGGLGVMSFESKVPELVRMRLNNLVFSDFPEATLIPEHDWGRQKLKWCNTSKIRDADWCGKLYNSTDGFELREARQSKLSTSWIEDPYVIIPSREYVQNIRTRINALPSKMRTTRGLRRQEQLTKCRAGCGEDETTAHIIQRCFRTHGGRVLRHDAVVNKTAELLENRGYRVEKERRYATRQGVRKPDIVAGKEGKVYIIDAQIVSGGPPLTELHRKKREKYADNSDLIRLIAERFEVHPDDVMASTITITWRGIWCKESEHLLCSLGLTRNSMRGLTTRVLQGSHTNFNRFNAMTTNMHGHRRQHHRNQRSGRWS